MHLSATLEIVLVSEIVGSFEYLCRAGGKFCNYCTERFNYLTSEIIVGLIYTSLNSLHKSYFHNNINLIVTL
jgi:hypothetical protein